MNIPEFSEKSAIFDWLIANKSALIAQKKASIKHADAYVVPSMIVTEKGDIIAKADAIPETATRIKVRSVINTTRLLDSHGDVHIDQLWNKSLKETKDNYLVNQHNFTFEGIISDNVHAFVKQIPWTELGFQYEGTTQALIYDSVIDKADSPFMFDMYRRGKVHQHSVGMRYVKVDLALNDDRYDKEFAVWSKYIDQVANKVEAQAQGWFFAVTEAKNIEGSAVVRGANVATPTLSVSEKSEPPEGTRGEPVDEPLKTLDVGEALKHYQP